MTGKSPVSVAVPSGNGGFGEGSILTHEEERSSDADGHPVPKDSSKFWNADVSDGPDAADRQPHTCQQPRDSPNR